MKLNEDCKEIVQQMQVIKKLGGKKYNTPNLIVITPDVKYIENIGKALLKEFKKYSGKNEKSEV